MLYSFKEGRKAENDFFRQGFFEYTESLTMIEKIINKIVWILPRKFLYFAVIRAWAIATTEKFTDKTPHEVDWDMVCRHLEK